MGRFMKKMQGTISVFLILVLLPTFVLTAVLIDGTIVFGSKNIMNDAGELAMRGVLANYDEALLRYYGLYGTGLDEETAEEKAKMYFSDTLSASSITSANLINTGVNLVNGGSTSREGRSFIKLANDGSAFSFNYVDYSQVWKPYVMDAQMLQYMKYRAPVILGSGLFDKLGNSGLDDVPAQKNCVKKQLAYEEKLADIQEDMNELHKDLKEGYVDKGYPNHSTKGYHNYDGILTWQSDLKTKMNELTLYYIADEAVKGYSPRGGAYGDSISAAKRVVELAGNLGSGGWEDFETIIEMMDAKEDVKDTDFTDGLEKDSDEYKEMEELLENYFEALEGLEDAKESLSNATDEKERNLREIANDYYDETKRLYELEKKSYELCEEIAEKLEETKPLEQNWEAALGKIKNDEIRDSFDKVKEKDTGSLFGEGPDDSGSAVVELKERIEEDRDYLEETLKKMERMTYVGVNFPESKSWSGIRGTASGYGSGIRNNSDVRSAAGSMMGEYNDQETFQNRKLYDIKNNAFYKQMDDYYCKPIEPEMSEEEAKEKYSQVQEQGKEEDRESADKSLNENLKKSLKDEKIPSHEGTGSQEALDNVDGVNDEKNALSNVGDPSKKKKDAKKAGDNLLTKSDNQFDGISTLAGKLSDGFEAIYESAYDATYVTEMLSCRTTGLADDNGQTLNGYEMKNDYLYQGEAEYVLWGTDVPYNAVIANETNIFAIRFALNTITAFTDPTLGNQATTMASSLGAVFPLSAPLIRSAILLGCSVAETSLDQNYLCKKGESVTLFKNSSTWYFKPLGPWTSKDIIKNGSVTLSYKDYTWMFLAAGMLSGDMQENKLTRVADCIELNFTKTSNFEGAETIMDDYTMVKMGSEVKIGTNFLQNVPAYLQKNGVSAQEYNEKDFIMTYQSALGY